MPQRRTAKKALRQNKKRREKNLQVKQKIKTAIKNFKKVIGSAKAAARAQELSKIYALLDKAAAKGLIHQNKAARKKSRLAKIR